MSLLCPPEPSSMCSQHCICFTPSPYTKGCLTSLCPQHCLFYPAYQGLHHLPVPPAWICFTPPIPSSSSYATSIGFAFLPVPRVASPPYALIIVVSLPSVFRAASPSLCPLHWICLTSVAQGHLTFPVPPSLDLLRPCTQSCLTSLCPQYWV